MQVKTVTKGKKISQIKLQMDTGIEQALISKYENNVRVPTTEACIVFADYFNVSLDYFLCRTEVK